MVAKDHEQGPHELVQALREKLAKANLSRDQVEKLRPPSLSKRDHCDLPPYKPGAYRRQCEEARKRLEKLENQRRPGFVPRQVQDKYMNEFYELKAQGKVSHLTPEMLEKLEKELKVSTADVKKHAELEEFLSSLSKQAPGPEYKNSGENHDGNFLDDSSVIAQEIQGETKKKKSIIKVRTHDGSLVPCFVFFESSLLCDTDLLHADQREPIKTNGQPKVSGKSLKRSDPVKVSSRTAKEVLDALNMVTEYIEHNNLEKYLGDLKELEERLRQMT